MGKYREVERNVVCNWLDKKSKYSAQEEGVYWLIECWSKGEEDPQAGKFADLAEGILDKYNEVEILGALESLGILLRQLSEVNAGKITIKEYEMMLNHLQGVSLMHNFPR